MATNTRKRKREVILGPKQCHPKLRTRDGNCLPREKLREVAVALGAPKTLKRPQLKHWMTRRTRCRSERCWVERAPMEGGRKKMLVSKFFRPTRPESWTDDPDDWLDGMNITEVLKQYEEIYPNFRLVGVFPIDFAAPDPYTKNKKHCLQDEVCDLDLKKSAEEGKTHLGFVYNLDPHFKEGSHWIASFTDIPGHKSYYFDSYGFEAPPQIARFLRSLTLQDPKMKLAYNARRFQYGETECGMYCIYFILKMLEGADFRKFCRSQPRDGEMLELRKRFFAPKDE